MGQINLAACSGRNMEWVENRSNWKRSPALPKNVNSQLMDVFYVKWKLHKSVRGSYHETVGQTCS